MSDSQDSGAQAPEQAPSPFALGWRPIALAWVCATCYVTYRKVARAVPEGFVEAGRELTQIPDDHFHSHLWRHLSAFVLLCLVPLLYGRIVEGWTARDLGLGVRSARRELRLCALILLGLIPLLWLASHLDGFQRTYPRVKATTDAPTLFLIFHGFYGLKWIAWEFFFRGFILFGFTRYVGPVAAVIISTIPFTLAHLGKPLPELYASFFFGILLCWITLRGRSVWPGVGLHWGVSLFLELFAAKFFRG